MSKIVEKIVEPAKIEVGSNFKLKVKVIRYITYGELKEQIVSTIKTFTINNLKGEE